MNEAKCLSMFILEMPKPMQQVQCHVILWAINYITVVLDNRVIYHQLLQLFLRQLNQLCIKLNCILTTSMINLSSNVNHKAQGFFFIHTFHRIQTGLLYKHSHFLFPGMVRSRIYHVSYAYKVSNSVTFYGLESSQRQVPKWWSRVFVV